MMHSSVDEMDALHSFVFGTNVLHFLCIDGTHMMHSSVVEMDALHSFVFGTYVLHSSV